MNNLYNMVDLFSGCGGMTLGFTRSGFLPVFSVEIDSDASDTYELNFSSSLHYRGDIKSLSDSDILRFVGGKRVHVVCAGFPCQGFSVMGKRIVDDERNSLYKQFVRISRVLQPDFVVGENVSGIMSMLGGDVVSAIINDFADVGFPGMDVRVLSAENYGTPQVRKRAFFLANRHCVENVYPEPRDGVVSASDAIGDLEDVEYNPDIDHVWSNHSQDVVSRLRTLEYGQSLYPGYRASWRRIYPDRPAFTVLEHHGGGNVHYSLPRTLSIRETARLQGFPDSFMFSGSMTSKRKQICNAVPPPLSEAVAGSVRSLLDTAIC